MTIIAHICKDTNREVVSYFSACLTSEQVAKFLGLSDGEWREITLEEAAIIQAPTTEEILQQYDAAVDERLEAFAKQLYSKGYANAVTYVNSSNPQWKLEAEYLIQLRDDTWQAAYAYMNTVLPQVQAKERDVPTLEEVFEALPVPTWPEGSRGYVG